MLDSHLKEFCRLIKPPVKYTETCREASANLFELLSAKSSYPISYHIIGGGLPIAKNTSTKLKADADVTIYVNWAKFKVIIYMLCV